jgi:hypothetical protein
MLLKMLLVNIWIGYYFKIASMGLSFIDRNSSFFGLWKFGIS